jgi:tetratricopeptide (TPR) repeat protein
MDGVLKSPRYIKSGNRRGRLVTLAGWEKLLSRNLGWRIAVTLALFVGMLARAGCLEASAALNLGHIAFARFMFSDGRSVTNANDALHWFLGAQRRYHTKEFFQRDIILAWIDATPPRTSVAHLSSANSSDFVEEEERRPRLSRAHALWTAAGIVDQAIAECASDAVVRSLGWGTTFQLIALSQKSERQDLADYWIRKVASAFPGREFQHLHSMDNPYAQTVLAEAYASLGFTDDAIRIGERALSTSDWSWGHYLITSYYIKQHQPIQAEHHFLAAVATAGRDPLINRYRLELADLYAKEGKAVSAIEQLCAILRDPGQVSNTLRSAAEKSMVQLPGGVVSCTATRR